jgi:hypothetical protein
MALQPAKEFMNEFTTHHASYCGSSGADVLLPVCLTGWPAMHTTPSPSFSQPRSSTML